MKLKDRAVILSLRILPQRYMSHVAGWFMSIRWPAALARVLVRGFGRFYGVNFDEVRDPIPSFPSIQAFFVRALKDGARPIDDATDAFVSPCDGAWGQCGTVEAGTALQVKGRPYAVRALVDDDELARALDGGSYATLYLSPRDYHRFHAPCDGDVLSARHVPGALWPVNSAGLHFVDGLFAKNERIIAVVRPAGTQHTLVLIAVGATNVGKVHVTFDDALTTNNAARATERHDYQPPRALTKGVEWGRFEFGSTIVVVASKGALSLDVQPAGTKLVLGRRIGTLHRA